MFLVRLAIIARDGFDGHHLMTNHYHFVVRLGGPYRAPPA